MLTIFQQIILGIVQGITEWLPISSSAAIVLILSNFYGVTNLHDLITTALFFHLGTFFAALIYFRRDVSKIFKTMFNYKIASEPDKKTFSFLLFATIIGGLLGILFLVFLDSFEWDVTGKLVSFCVGILLLFTGILQLKIKKGGLKDETNLKFSDAVTLGVAQGVSALPGISRSGITVSTLLLRKFKDTTALRLSFLMSLPIVLVANIILNYQDLIFTSNSLYGLVSSFVFGILTIHALMKLSKKINFGWFVIIFAALMVVSVLV